MKKIFLWLISLMFLGSGLAYAGTYTDSAHGNSGYGVDRKDPFPAYAKGNCAHCHEQHASIGGTEPDPKTDDAEGPDNFCLLANNFDTTPTIPYDQDDNACFFCHTSSASLVSLQTGVVDNNNYGATFAGGTVSAAGIFQAFKLTSYHNLSDVLDFAKSEWSSTFTADSNPCSACHNVHIAQRSCGKPTGSYDPTKSAISKPNDHGNLWGDNERMNAYTSGYRAPFYVGANPAADPTLHEPDGVSRSISSDEVKGSNLPDYVTLCTDCHNATNSITSQALGTLKFINWAGDQHGKINGAGSDDGNRIAPYTTDGTTGTIEDTTADFVLSCMDCHEPHGSSNEYLLRTTVNGTAVSITETGRWYNFCTACHSVVLSAGNHLSVVDADYTCNNAGCHYHGSDF